MRAARNTDDGVRVVDVPEPEGAGELVAMRSVSICGSDFGYMAGGARFVLGHELAGLTADGSPVAIEGIFGCGTCPQCTSGAYNRCPEIGLRTPGMSMDGGMAEFFRAPATALVPLPQGLDVADASLVEPGAVAWHGLRMAGVGPATRVGVVGGGAIGLLAVAGARRLGAAELGLEARHPAQRAAGERLGATTASGVYDVVVEAAGSESALARCVDLCAPGGAIVILGLYPGVLPLPFIPAFLKEVRVLHSIAYSADGPERDVDAVARMLAEDPQIAATLITHRFPLEDAREAFRVAGDRAAGAIKVVVQP